MTTLPPHTFAMPPSSLPLFGPYAPREFGALGSAERQSWISHGRAQHPNDAYGGNGNGPSEFMPT